MTHVELPDIVASRRSDKEMSNSEMNAHVRLLKRSKLRFHRSPIRFFFKERLKT